MPTTEITLRGLRLEVEFLQHGPDIELFEVRHRGECVLCLIDHHDISRVRYKVQRNIEEGKCHT